MKKTILILGLLVIIPFFFIFKSGMSAHEKGSKKFLEEMGYSEVELLDTSLMSKSFEYKVLTKEQKVDTIYVALTERGGYSIRYFKNNVWEK